MLLLFVCEGYHLVIAHVAGLSKFTTARHDQAMSGHPMVVPVEDLATGQNARELISPRDAESCLLGAYDPLTISLCI